MQENQLSEPQESEQKRILSLDFLRGISIILVLIFHGVVFNAFSNVQSAQSDVPMILQLFLLPLIILGGWASFFAMISGASVTYAMYRNIIIKGKNPKTVFKGAISRTLQLILFHFIYSYLFIHPSTNIYGDIYQGLIPGSIERGFLYFPPITICLMSSAFIMLAFSNFFVSLVLYLIWSRKPGHRIKRVYSVLLIIGSLYFVLTPVLQIWLTPIMYDAFERQDYLLGIFMTWVIGRDHCAFPFVGNAFFGAIFGLALVEHKGKELISAKGKRIGQVALLLAFIALIWEGIPEYPWGVQPLSVALMNLGLQSFAFIFVSGKLDYATSEEEKHKSLKTMGIRRWGKLSNTVFLIETSTSTLFAAITNLIFPELLDNFILAIVIWAPLYTYLWWRIGQKWEQSGFKYSIEWFLNKNKRKKNNVREISTDHSEEEPTT